MPLAHFSEVDLPRIKARFFVDHRHRATLLMPFKEREVGITICVIGQNPSAANEQHADNTIRYLERYVFEKLPQYGRIPMLNLYSCVDTRKTELSDINNPNCDRILRDAIAGHNEFLVVFGKLKNQGSYRFQDRVRLLRPLFEGKRVYKFDLGTRYAPHPGNRSIHYHVMGVNLALHDFSDVD